MPSGAGFRAAGDRQRAIKRSRAAKGRLSLKRHGSTSIAANLARRQPRCCPSLSSRGCSLDDVEPTARAHRPGQVACKPRSAPLTAVVFETNVAGLTSGLHKTGKMEGEDDGACLRLAPSAGTRSRAFSLASLLHNDAPARTPPPKHGLRILVRPSRERSFFRFEAEGATSKISTPPRGCRPQHRRLSCPIRGTTS